MHADFTLENFLAFMDDGFDNERYEEEGVGIDIKCPIAQFAETLYGEINGIGFTKLNLIDGTQLELPEWASEVAVETAMKPDATIRQIKVAATGV